MNINHEWHFRNGEVMATSDTKDSPLCMFLAKEGPGKVMHFGEIVPDKRVFRVISSLKLLSIEYGKDYPLDQVVGWLKISCCTDVVNHYDKISKKGK